LEEGCDKLIVVLTREHGYVKTTEKAIRITDKLYKKYPKIVEAMDTRAERYNEDVKNWMSLSSREKFL